MINNQVICTTRSDGTKVYRLGDLLHREDGPAIEYPDGTKYWYQHHQRHRVDGPAMEDADGTKFWCQHHQLHRTDGPAIEYADGTQRYYLYDQSFDTQQTWQQAQDQLARGQIYYFDVNNQNWIKILNTYGGILLGVSERKYYSDSGKIRKAILFSNTCLQRLSLTTTIYLQHQDQLVWVDDVPLLQLQALPFPELPEFKLFPSQLK